MIAHRKPLAFALLFLPATVVLGSACGGDCEFALIASTEECPASCATFTSVDTPEALLCTPYDCTSPDNACENNSRCVVIGSPVCLPVCNEDDDCAFGLACVDQPDAVTGDDVGTCFFPD